MSKKLLLISNSTNLGEAFLAYARKYISDFLGKEVRNVVFVPYAAVEIPYIEYTNKVTAVFSELGYDLKSTEDVHGAKEVLKNADAIVVGGGNTFNLLFHLQQKGLIDIIRKKVENGTPYIGWSAGSNIACPSIKTTNDMPIIQPASLDALSLVPFQINPHFTDGRIPGHNGEGREDRIREFLHLNPQATVVGLREGSMLKIEGTEVCLQGSKTLKLFRKDMPSLEYDASTSLDFLLQ
jgi:dipeptidase E